MKRTLTQAILSASLGLALQAQTNVPPPPDWSAWTVTAMDDCSTTREFRGSVTNQLTGVVTPRSSRIIELATGLNFQDSSGVWTESQDLIEPLTSGGTAAVNGRYSVYFSPAGLNDDAALTIVSQSNRVYQARVLGIYYFDAQSGQSNLLATPSDAAVAEILPPNQIVFRGAFNSPKLKADLRYTYTKAAFESDVIITSQPKVSPADCGLNPDTTLIQVRHQWLGASMPKIQEVTVGRGSGPDLVDQLLDFGDLWFPSGRAFAWGDDAGRGTNAAQISLPGAGGQTGEVPVAKEWQAAGSKPTLIESVSWDSVAPMLAQLPTIAKVVKDPKETRLAAAGRLEATANGLAAARRTIQVASRPYRAPGVVLDYIVVSGSGSYDFQPFNGTNTFLVTSNCYFSGALTFEAGCVVEFKDNTYLLTYYGVACNGTEASPSVLTSCGDFAYGEADLGYSPPPCASIALWLYGVTTSQTLQWLTVRNATTALGFNNGGTCGTTVYSVNNCSLFNCTYGVAAYYQATVSMNNSTCCEVSTPVVNQCCGVQGALAVVNPPTITTSPSSQCQFVLPNNNVTFTAAASPSPCTYAWVVNGSRVGTSQSVTLGPSQLGTSYGGQRVWVYATDGNGTANPAYGWVGIVDSSALAVAQRWTDYTNNATTSLWSCRDNGNPPTCLKWNTSCLLYGNPGFTAISQRNEFEPLPGQCPVTALTSRHGYTRGHGMGVADGNVGLTNAYNGKRVYFCTGDGNNTLVTAYIANSFIRYDTTNRYDYTIFIFTQDLPSTIQPMAIPLNYGTPTSYSVVFNTEQYGQMTANNPPFGSGFLGTGDPYAFPPFNQAVTFKPGDSGSPNMLPWWADDALVFLGGDTTSPASAQMQADMDTLTRSLSLKPSDYQMTMHAVQ